MRRDIVFVHIPKTAGTSLRNALERVASDHLILRDYGSDPITTPKLYELAHVRRRPEQFRETFRSGRKGILLSGHFPASRYWNAFHAESFATIVRDPVDRVISEYNHYVSYKGWTSPLEEFALQPRFRNVISTFLAGVDLARFGFIAATEELESVRPALEEYLGTSLLLKRQNVGDYASREVTDTQRAMIAELNREDISLHRRLLEERSATPRAPGADAAIRDSYLGHVVLQERGVLAGWLCNTAREFIAQVDILDGARKVASLRADRFSRFAKEKGYSRSGFCGFRLDLSEFSLSTAEAGRLRVVAKDSGYELSRSPPGDNKR